MDSKDLTSLLSPSQLRDQLSPQTRVTPSSSLPFLVKTKPASLPHPLLGALETLRDELISELKRSGSRLLSLNPSRQKQLLDLLITRANDPAYSTKKIPSLKAWFEIVGSEDPVVPSSATLALHSFYEEVALLYLGQALVLKSWCERENREFEVDDLGRMEWIFRQTLRAKNNSFDREHWQFVRQNLYTTWFRPSDELTHKTHALFKGQRLVQENGDWLLQMLETLRRCHPPHPEPSGFDDRFIRALWKASQRSEFVSEASTKRIRRAYSPTLRQGNLVRTAPQDYSWVGFEASDFRLILGELSQLWTGPKSAPLWTSGHGLEAHPREQIAFGSFGLATPCRDAVCNLIAEVESCEVGFVFEERVVRASGRSSEALSLKEKLEALPYYRPYRSSETSLGVLQALIAAGKLRQGGLLWWCRDERLSAEENAAALKAILDRCTLVAEWDFSAMDHQLPTQYSLFPKTLYLFRRELRIETRRLHQPRRIRVQGSLRSHVELEVFLDDVIQSAWEPRPARGAWEILARTSPLTQNQWTEHWPAPEDVGDARLLSTLERQGVRLGTRAMVRPAQGLVSRKRGDFTVRWCEKENRLELVLDEHAPKGAFTLSFSESDSESAAVLACLGSYFESRILNTWMLHHKKGVLNETLLKWIPLPPFWDLLAPSKVMQSDAPAPAPHAWREWMRLPEGERTTQLTQWAQMFSNAPAPERLRTYTWLTLQCESVRLSLRQTTPLITRDGCPRWSKLLAVLPPSELIPFRRHSGVKLQGTLTPNLPIVRIDPIKAPERGFLLLSESSPVGQISIQSHVLFEMLEDLLRGFDHPTLLELDQHLRLPRKMELAESTASSILQTHLAQLAQLRSLRAALDEISPL